jgi:hypothetical protein
MDKKKKIEKEVAETLLLLEKGERTEVNPYLAERVIAKLESGKSADNSPSRIGDFLKPALLVVLFLVNFLSFWLIMENGSGEENNPALRDKYLSRIAGDYNLVQSDYFTYNNE